MSFIKNHPFPVQAYFDSSLVLSFAVPKEILLPLIPSCLSLDTFDDKWGFIAVAMVQTSGLRPKGFPALLGNDFFLIGYRIFVRYTNQAGKKRRGLFILRSETDKHKMAYIGNFFTHYNYHKIDIQQSSQGDKRFVSSSQANFEVEALLGDEQTPLPKSSPFDDWKTARKFSGPLPFTFTYLKEKKSVLIIQGVRQNWKPRPVEVLRHRIGFVDSLNLKGIVLANAFVIEQVPYYWKKGIIEAWNTQTNF